MNSKTNHVRMTFWGRMFQEAAEAALTEVATKGALKPLDEILADCGKAADRALVEFDKRFNKPAEPKVLGGAAIAGVGITRKPPIGDYANAAASLRKSMTATFDNSTAVSEGWMLSVDGIHHVVVGCSVDGNTFNGVPFNSVAEAVAHVNKQATGGSKYHQLALYLHLKATSPAVDLGGQHSVAGVPRDVALKPYGLGAPDGLIDRAEFDNTQALSEGWAVFADGRIRRLEKGAKIPGYDFVFNFKPFETEEAAVEFVARKADEGSAYHNAAMDKYLNYVSGKSSTPPGAAPKVIESDYAESERRVLGSLSPDYAALLSKYGDSCEEIRELRDIIEAYLGLAGSGFKGCDYFELKAMVTDRYEAYKAKRKSGTPKELGLPVTRPLYETGVRELEVMLQNTAPINMASLVAWLRAHNIQLEKLGQQWKVVDNLDGGVFTTNAAQMCVDHLMKMTRGKGSGYESR